MRRLLRTFAAFAVSSAFATPRDASAAPAHAEKDDPLQRIRSRLRREGALSPDQLLEVQREALRDASRFAPRRAGSNAPSAVAPIAPGAVVNVGPDGSTFDRNVVTYPNVDSGRARTIIPHPLDPDILYLATAGGGVWKTFDATAAHPHWESITDHIVALGTGSLALDPNSPDSLVLGLGDPFDMRMPGVYFTADGGISWSGPTPLLGCYGTACTTAVATSVRDLKYNGSNTGVILAATDLGLFRNTAHGTGSSWALVEMPTATPHTPMDCFSVSWVGGTTWLLACTDDSNAGYWGNGFLWRSVDDGASWSPVALASVNLGGGLTTQGRMTIAAAAGDAAAPATARVYLLASDVGGFAQLDVYKSHDGGQSFAPLGVNQTRTPLNPNADQTDLNVMHDQAWYNQAIAVDPANGDTVFAGGNLALVRSTDGGGTWKVIADWLPYDFTVAGVTYNSLGIPYVHADFHAMAIGTARARVFYAGTDGGIFRSSDAFAAAPGVPATGPGGVVSPTFDDSMNRGLPTHLLYTVCAGAEDVGSPAVILGGLQDNGSRLRNAGTPTNFDMVTGGDGIGCGVGKAFGTGAFGTLLITTFPGDIARSTNSGVDFKRAVTGLPATIDGQTNFHMRIANDPTDATAQTFLTPINSAASASGVTAQVFRTTDGAANWSDITGAVNGGGPFPKELLGVFASAAAPGNYLAFSAGRIFVTTNATVGATAITWSMNSTVFAQQPISSAAFDPNDTTGSIAWVTSHAPPNLGHHVFRATAANTSTPVWTDMSGTGGANPLPDVPATIVRLDPRDASSKTIYVGTDIGLYASTDGGANWTRFGSGMPAVKITDLAIARDGTSLRIATFGRGFWELYPNAGVPAAVAADGDHDGNQMIDGFDLIAEAAALGADVSSPTYDPKSHLTGTTNSITWADMLALLAKFGGRP